MTFQAATFDRMTSGSVWEMSESPIPSAFRASNETSLRELRKIESDTTERNLLI